jgi:hypothetical protein
MSGLHWWRDLGWMDGREDKRRKERLAWADFVMTI